MTYTEYVGCPTGGIDPFITRGRMHANATGLARGGALCYTRSLGCKRGLPEGYKGPPPVWVLTAQNRLR